MQLARKAYYTYYSRTAGPADGTAAGKVDGHDF
jgi:hypothetical protein